MAWVLIGDLLLLFGTRGCAKTHLVNRIAEPWGRRFLVCDAAKALFIFRRSAKLC